MSRLHAATVFVAIGAVLFVLFDRFGPWQSGRGYRPRPVEVVSGGATELRRAVDGHFHVSGTINGQPVVFLVDTGASTVSVDEVTARSLALGTCRDTVYGTAAGKVRGCEARAREVSVAGVRAANVRVAVLPAQREGLALLGMNVLRHFRIETEGGTMRLTPTGD